jgi:flavin-dependent dehydrogenase
MGMGIQVFDNLRGKVITDNNIANNINASIPYNVAIIGGGLSGLSLSILLSKAGYKTILFEKEKYPFHRVCGEYISMESWKFIEGLGLDLSTYNLPILKKLIVSSPNGNIINADLDMGGFGISRFFIDNELKKIAVVNGVKVMEETKVSDVIFKNDVFTVVYSGGEILSHVVCGSFGKRSNLDVKWSRNFIQKKPGKLNNYIGVKYHIKNTIPSDTIALHNFKNGYCGMSKVEDDKYCLCYLTTAQNLKENNNSIKKMEQNILYKNPLLKKIFTGSEFIFPEPVTISQISFDEKLQVENHVLMTGDAAGMITPLCGNGMSMALHSSKIAAECINHFLNKNISRSEMERQYVYQWKVNFGRRLRAGRIIQKLFGKEHITNWFVSTMNYFPSIVKKIIEATHGKEF